MATQLRRTLVRSVLYSAIFVLTACKNHESKQQQIAHDFDTVNKELQSSNEKIDRSTQVLYDAVAAKYSESFLRQFNYTISDAKANIKDLRWRFYQFCGDSTGTAMPEDNIENIALINQFFINEKNAEQLYYNLLEVESTLTSHNDDPQLDEQIHGLTGSGSGKRPDSFTNNYFKDVPPVAASTILSKFENDINTFERKVLQQILKPVNVTPK